MIDFIDDNRHQYRVELTCRVLSITPSTYYRAKDLSNNPEKCSLCSQHNDFYIIEIKRIWQDSKCEPPRNCRRLNILREYDNEKTNLHS